MQLRQQTDDLANREVVERLYRCIICVKCVKGYI